MSRSVGRRIVFLANSSWNLWNFRARMARLLAAYGFDIVFVAPVDAYSGKLSALGRFVPIRLDPQGKNPFAEALSLVRIYLVLKEEGDCTILSWTPKANIYGGLVSRFLGLRFIPNIAGLGYAYSGGNILVTATKALYSLSLKRAPIVFFQNSDDESVFVGSGIIGRQVARLLPGSGVDIDAFIRESFIDRDPFVFLYAGRLLEQKGIRYLVAASRQLQACGHSFIVKVVGFADEGHPTSIKIAELNQWQDEGVIRYLGRTDNIAGEIYNAHCVVHPSFYREGRPRILLEAAACGRPAITTNSVGCRDAVKDNVTGFLCEPRCASGLAAAMEAMMLLPQSNFEAMSIAARRLAEEEFSDQIVFEAYERALQQE